MTARAGRWLRLSILAVMGAFFVLPIVAGFSHSLRAAFGILPGIGAEVASLDPWRELFSLPGLWRSIALTLWTGFAATVLSLVVAMAVVRILWGRFSARSWARFLTPFLAAPHAAIAVGLAFVLAPSGWIARAISPWATGWTRPPDIATVQDPLGLALIVGLMIKEVPFLILVLLAALSTLPVAETLRAGRSLGHKAATVWMVAIIPQAYRVVRLPVYVVLSFSLSVVDMALILGPTTPPTLAVAMVRWFQSADTAMLLPAAASAVLLSAIVVAAMLAFRLFELVAEKLLCHGLWSRRPRAGLALWLASRAAASMAGVLWLSGLFTMGALVLWSISWRWTFPDVLPSEWSTRAWVNGADDWMPIMLRTFGIGFAATLLAVALAVLWLDSEDRGHMARAGWANYLVYLPLIFPQIVFLPGLYTGFLSAGFMPGLYAVIWAHLLFVFPYVLLTLTDPWRALDPRLAGAAASLGAGPWRRLWSIKIPLLVQPIATAAAVGFAVSVSLYLPTLFAGAGRVATVTTEAVALSSGSDRRAAAVQGVLQLALPFLAYAAAVTLSRRRFTTT